MIRIVIIFISFECVQCSIFQYFVPCSQCSNVQRAMCTVHPISCELEMKIPKIFFYFSNGKHAHTHTHELTCPAAPSNHIRIDLLRIHFFPFHFYRFFPFKCKFFIKTKLKEEIIIIKRTKNPFESLCTYYKVYGTLYVPR